ncbi:MAG: putative protein ninG [Prokaryotic dsDNA virus sp.]|nr:MAG: putative protein ninG [Prokaryotic dsDNA virus sp.]|tara:strand:- start:2228 stop:2758 length:531 start_codon:yes stop_codon:yes gene_type:complete
MRCKNCKEKFEPKQFNRKFCYKDECIDAYFEHLKKEASKKWNREKKKRKEKLQTTQELMKVAQTIFNKYIRLRDKGNPCISCGNPVPKKINAGHYIASGKSKFLTFNEDNVHLQCEYCNTYLHGNLLDYRINLIKKIGIDRVQYLEENRHKTKKYTREELKKVQKKYKKLYKNLLN